MIEVISTRIPDVKRIRQHRFGDQRGFFWEPFNQKAFQEAGLPTEFVQDNHSFSSKQGTIRGLHYQISPFDQGKLVWVVRGSILDVAVDMRKASPTLGRVVSLTLTADFPEQIWVPSGFAHGFCTLEANTDVLYKVTKRYSPQHERGIAWNDPDLNINWPVEESEAIVSEKDRGWPCLQKVKDLF